MKMVADSGLALSLYSENISEEAKCLNGILGPLLGLSMRPQRGNKVGND